MAYNKIFGYETWLYIAFAFWGFDRIARPFRILLLNWEAWDFPSHPSATAELLPGDEFIKSTVFPSLIWKVSAGQHCFLYFPSLKTNPFQSHPFSVASWNDGTMPRPQSLNPTPSFFEQSPHILTPISSSSLAPMFELQDLPLNATDHSPQSNPSKPSISFLVRPEHGIKNKNSMQPWGLLGIHKELITCNSSLDRQ